MKYQKRKIAIILLADGTIFMENQLETNKEQPLEKYVLIQE